MGISFWQIAIVVVLVVLLFGRGKISSLMGDVAKGLKVLKKVCLTIQHQIIKKIIQSPITQILKINNQNASNWMVRDFISSNNCNNSFRPQRISDCVKKNWIVYRQI